MNLENHFKNHHTHQVSVTVNTVCWPNDPVNGHNTPDTWNTFTKNCEFSSSLSVNRTYSLCQALLWKHHLWDQGREWFLPFLRNFDSQDRAEDNWMINNLKWFVPHVLFYVLCAINNIWSGFRNCNKIWFTTTSHFFSTTSGSVLFIMSWFFIFRVGRFEPIPIWNKRLTFIVKFYSYTKIFIRTTVLKLLYTFAAIQVV